MRECRRADERPTGLHRRQGLKRGLEALPQNLRVAQHRHCGEQEPSSLAEIAADVEARRRRPTAMHPRLFVLSAVA